jgi:S1-C subfamily serine protease
MNPLRSLLAAAVVSCCAAPVGAQPATPSPEELYRYLAPSVWLVRTYDADGLALATGSAVVIGNETLLTNCHVLEKAKRFVIRNENVQHDAKLQHIDVARDLCQITARNLRAPKVELADSDKVSVGQKVYALGNPRGLELTLSDGLVSALRRDEDHRDLVLIQTSAPISQGSSGGGLFDSQGRLIGITTLITRDAQNLNFAIPINWQRDLAARSDAALRAPAVAAATRAPVPPPAPAAPGTASVADVDAVPVNAGCKTEYRKYIAFAPPKAFAITDKGRCYWQGSRKPSRPEITASPDPAVRAMELCVYSFGTGCMLYAIDSNVVYRRQ